MKKNKPAAMSPEDMINIIKMSIVGAPIEVSKLSEEKWEPVVDVGKIVWDFSKYKFRVADGRRYRPWLFAAEVPIGAKVSRRGEYTSYVVKAVKWYGPTAPFEVVLAGGSCGGFRQSETTLSPEQLFHEFCMENASVCGVIDNTKEEFI